jgi:hypothetical protein
LARSLVGGEHEGGLKCRKGVTESDRMLKGTTMSEKSQRAVLAEARKAARDAQTKQREAARARERRVLDLATTVIAAMDERDLVVERTELRAGEALRELVDVEGLSVRETLEACGRRLDEREATRLRRVVRIEEKQAVAVSAGPSRDTVTASV